MKKNIFSAFLLSAVTLVASAQQVVEDNLQCLHVRYETPSLQFTSQALDGHKYLILSLQDYSLGGEVGAPALPILSHYIATPFCTSIEVTVQNALYDTLTLADANQQLYPLQAPRSKRDTLHPLAFNHERYATDASYGMPLVKVQPLGVERDRHLALLTFAPLTINPVTGQVVICRSADITINYIGADIDRTLGHYRRYHTPAFATTRTLNAPFAKTTTPQAPVSMLIVAGNLSGIRHSQSLARFVEWKRTQGYLVEVIYSDDLASNTTAAITTAIRQRYLDATEATPAPTYLLLIGDHAQLPAFDCNISSDNFLRGYWYQLDDHITDHYYSTWTDDNLRDCFLGRFSATDTNQLNNIINKTLLYERYQFSDDSYLARATLVSGIDRGDTIDNRDNAWRCADPTMDYIARYYITADNGFTDVAYYKNNSSFAPTGVTVTGTTKDRNTATTLRNLYNEGIGWINYSAHGFETGWGDPSFTNTHVGRMTNNGMPSFMIGNCCLTNHFNTDACFGETLLRKDDNAGAIGYIGGTNSTFWDEDFYFAVGVRSNIYNRMSPSYDANNLGAYDRLFHTHNESFLSRNITAGAIVHSGLMAVNSQAHTSTQEHDMVEYYWEIYELMGDPSLMPWLGRATDLDATASISGSSITVQTEPYAYVALVDHDLSLIAAAYATSSGAAMLEVPADRDLAQSFFSITAQNRKPFTRPYSSMILGIEPGTSQASIAPNPATNRCTIKATGLRRVQLLDLVGHTLLDLPCTDACTINLDAFEAGIYLVRTHTSSGMCTSKLIVTK